MATKQELEQKVAELQEQKEVLQNQNGIQSAQLQQFSREVLMAKFKTVYAVHIETLWTYEQYMDHLKEWGVIVNTILAE
jgi:hypothetical protein